MGLGFIERVCSETMERGRDELWVGRNPTPQGALVRRFGGVSSCHPNCCLGNMSVKERHPHRDGDQSSAGDGGAGGGAGT